MFGEFGHAPELIVLLVAAVLLSGFKNWPELGKGLGEAIGQFRRALSGDPPGRTADHPTPPEVEHPPQ